MNIDQIKDLLLKYRQGACSAAELKIIEWWLSDNKNDRNNFSDEFIDTQLKSNNHRINAIINKRQGSLAEMWNSWLAVAASIVVIFAFSGAICYLVIGSSATYIAAKPASVHRMIKGWVYIETPKGLTDHIELPDGSLVTLNSFTRLRYPAKFTNHKRPVYLDEGEAFFEVAKDQSSPFTVYTNNYSTTALGTAFTIRSYTLEHKIVISLIHGKIRVNDLNLKTQQNASKILLPHQQLVFNKASGSVNTINFNDEEPITSWQKGVLDFQAASSDEVINSIENRFNVIIVNKSKRTNWGYTGTFKNETLDDVLKTICLTEGITYSINKTGIILHNH